MSLTILVLEDIEETRDGIEKLLKADGYHVEVARGVEDAVESARRKRPDLILVGLGGTPLEVATTALSVRERAKLGGRLPVVMFYTEEVEEGVEVEIGENLYLTRPDNFNQLRELIARLLREATDH